MGPVGLIIVDSSVRNLGDVSGMAIIRIASAEQNATGSGFLGVGLVSLIVARSKTCRKLGLSVTSIVDAVASIRLISATRDYGIIQARLGGEFSHFLTLLRIEEGHQRGKDSKKEVEDLHGQKKKYSKLD